MKDIGTTAVGMELVEPFLPTTMSLKELMIGIRDMAMACTNGTMDVCTLDSSSKIKGKDEVPTHGPMVLSTKENSRLATAMDKECTDSRTALSTLASGRVANTTELER